MEIAHTILIDRAWAIPALSGLLLLHQDFDVPRHVAPRRLDWQHDAVRVTLQYGAQNVSGTVLRAVDLNVTLYRNGSVAVQAIGAAGHEEDMLAQFLAGEIFRESERCREDVALWRDHQLMDEERAALFSIVSALLAHPLPEMAIQVERQRGAARCVRRVRLLAPAMTCELMALGTHGVTIFRKGGTLAGGADVVQHPAVWGDAAPAAKPLLKRLPQALFAACAAFLLLPLDFAVHLFEQLRYDEVRQVPGMLDADCATLLCQQAARTLL